MKRFALKRITALVLALVMTLSLMPMNVWAEEAGTEPESEPVTQNAMTADKFIAVYGVREIVTPGGKEVRVFPDANNPDYSLSAASGNFHYNESAYDALFAMWQDWCALLPAEQTAVETAVPGATHLIYMCAYQVHSYSETDEAAAKAFYNTYFLESSNNLTLKTAGTADAAFQAWSELNVEARAYLQQNIGPYSFVVPTPSGQVELTDNFTQKLFELKNSASTGPSVFEKLAEAGYVAPEANELKLTFPAGLVQETDYAYAYTDGVLTVTLKKGEPAHWKTAYQNMRADGNNIEIGIDFPDAPSTAAKFGMLSSNMPDGKVVDFINIDNNGGSCCDRSAANSSPRFLQLLASVNEQGDSATIAPVGRDNGHYFLLAYVDESGTPLAKWVVQFRVLVEEPFTHEVEKKTVGPVPADRITIASYDASKWSVTKVDGMVTAQAQQKFTAQERVCTVTIEAPTGYTLKGQTWTRVDNGLWFPGAGAWSFTWVDNSGNEIYEQLAYKSLNTVPYLANLGDPAKFSLTKTSDSITVSYDEDLGRYHTSFSSNKIPSVEELLAGMKMEVPTNAKTYRWHNGEGNRDPLAEVGGVTLETLRNCELTTIDNPEGYIVPIANVGVLELDNGELKVYYSRTRNTTERVVEWYSDLEGNPENALGVSYIYGNNDDFFWSTTSQSVPEVNAPVEKPTIESTVSMTLTGIRYPQLGNENKLYIELKASEIQKDGNVVYIPYSYCNGMTWEIASQLKQNGKSPMIHHYTDDHGSYSVIKGEYTEYGIRFVTPDFSPFTITWDSAERVTGLFDNLSADAKAFAETYLDYNLFPDEEGNLTYVQIFIKGAPMYWEGGTCYYPNAEAKEIAEDFYAVYDALPTDVKEEIDAVRIADLRDENSPTIAVAMEIYREALERGAKDLVTDIDAFKSIDGDAYDWLNTYVGYNAKAGEAWFKSVNTHRDYPTDKASYDLLAAACAAYVDLSDTAKAAVAKLFVNWPIPEMVDYYNGRVQLDYYGLLDGVSNEDVKDYVNTYVEWGSNTDWSTNESWYYTDILGAHYWDEENERDMYNPDAVVAALEAYDVLDADARVILDALTLKMGNPDNANDYGTPTFKQWMQVQRESTQPVDSFDAVKKINEDAYNWLNTYMVYYSYIDNGEEIWEVWFDGASMKNGYPADGASYGLMKAACEAYIKLSNDAKAAVARLVVDWPVAEMVSECCRIVQLPYYTLLTGVEDEDAVEFIKTYVACHAYGNWYMTELVGAWQHNDETNQDVYNPTAAKAALDAYANLSDAAKKELASQVVKQGDPYNPNDFWTPTFAEWIQRQQTDYLFQTNPEAGTLSNPDYMTDASAKAFFKEYFDYSTYTDSGCVVIGFQLKDGRMAPDGGHLTQESLALAKKMMVAYNALSATAKSELDKLCVDAYRNMSFTGRLMDEYSNPYMSDPTGTLTKDALSEKAKQFLKEAGLILSDTGALSIDGAPIVEIEGEDRFYIDYNQKDTDKGLAGWNTAKTPLAAYYGKEFEGTSSAAPIWERDWELYDELNQLKITVDGEEMWFESAMQYFRSVWEKMYYSGYYEEYMFHAAGYVAPVLGENFTVRVPAGLVEGVDYSFEYTTTDQENPEKNGVLTIHIKAGEKEHWRQAFYNSDKISRSSGILFGVEFLRPAGADHQANICGQGTTGVFAKYLDNSGEHPKELYESGYDLGENEKSVGNGRMMAAINQIGNTVTITPCDHYAVDHMLVVWYDSSKVANGYNTAVVGDRFMLRFRVVVDEDFNYEFNIPSKPAEVERIDIVPEGKWTVVKNIPGELIVRPLDGTISETLNGLEQTENGTYEFGNFTLTPPADGYVLDVEESNELTQEGYVKVLSGNTLSLYANAWNGGNRTTVFYTFVWEKAGAEDIVQELTVRVTENRSYFADIKNDNGTPNNPDDDIVAQPVSTADVAAAATITGMKKAYDEQLGFLETTFDQMPSLEDVKALYNREGVMMTPPQGTMYFRWTGGDGNQDLAYINIAEANEVRFGLRDGDIKPLYRNGTLSPEAQHELVFEYASIETLDVGDLTIYFAATQNYRWSAVEWLDENKNTIGYTYIYGKNGAIVQTETTESVSSEAELPVNSSGQLEKPIIIGEGMNFTANRYIQEGGGGKHWYLRLSVDEESNLDEVKGNWVYLPYDYVGLTWEQAKELKTAGYNPTIYHYAQGEAMPPEKIVGEYAPQGIKFNVKSFSPFVIDVSATEGNKGENTEGNTGGTPGGYYPIVTPTTPVEKPTDTKPTTPAKPVAPPAEVTVPVSGDENTINVEASVSGSTATIDKVDMTKLEGVIGDDVAVGTVTIDFSDLESSETIDTVEIPADVVKEIAEAVADPNNDAESLEIVLSDGASIEFDAAALAEKASQAGGADITISIKQAVENVLSAAQQAAVGDRVAFDINVTSGGVHISDMGGKITIHAPYELRDGETAEGIVVYYVDDEGNQEKCETSYDSVKKRVNWKTDHLSVYMIAHEAPATDDAPAVDNAPADDATQNDSGNSVGLWIGVVLVVLVAAIVVLMILIKRKKA